jgi:hypothetical protein
MSSRNAWIVIPGLVSVLVQLTKSQLPPLSKSPWHRKGSRRSPSHPIHWISPHQTFSLSKSEVRVVWALAVPGQLQDELGRDHAHYCQRWVRHCILELVWVLLQVHLDWQWLPWEKWSNKHLSNSSHCFFIKIFKFDFDSISYLHPSIKEQLQKYAILIKTIVTLSRLIWRQNQEWKWTLIFPGFVRPPNFCLKTNFIVTGTKFHLTMFLNCKIHNNKVPNKKL